MAENIRAFPPPPPLFELYASDATALPPPPPISDDYQLFGVPHTVDCGADSSRTLEEQGYECLYSKELGEEGGPTYQSELRRLNRALLHGFADVLRTAAAPEEDGGATGAAGSSAQDPTQTAKLKHLKDILINAHDLLNTFRDHQARDTLAETLRQQVREKQEVGAWRRPSLKTPLGQSALQHSILERFEAPLWLRDAAMPSSAGRTQRRAPQTSERRHSSLG